MAAATGRLAIGVGDSVAGSSASAIRNGKGVALAQRLDLRIPQNTTRVISCGSGSSVGG
jgi:hypothetical protein